MKGIELIKIERARQIEKEGFDKEHDREHEDGELALAAACYCTPIPLLEKREGLNEVGFYDPWPFDKSWDKRYRCGETGRNEGNYLSHPDTYTKKQRIDLLVKAGALIAAEIDRLTEGKR